ncbi:DUF3558 domain-containing protein [Nocardia higoensis]|uniref:DUF3558 domain-containing protein n=1 Tax=Nocardia higoensis TaxID=228599 RepID=A0ABS0DDW4_9NOCA|nr:DUF3558 domain-containing protein [Nocardia higoensis]MBF6356662.1 DUF3558 domain-containing protein [Nocardia higoensis]
MRSSFAAGFMLMSASTLVACSSATDRDSATSVSAIASSTAVAATASVKVSVQAAPAQAGTEQVQSDPCTSVGDDLVTRAGFDPDTRERYSAESVSMPFTRIGCQFWRAELVDGEEYPTGLVTVTSSDLTLDDIRKNPGHSIFNSDPIGGREAVLYRTPQNDGTCSASVESTLGTFTVGLIVHPGPVAVPPACEEIQRIAAIFTESLTAE